MTIEATYSAEDNKIRLYASERLDDETFQRVKAAGFRWAPKQELFVAPSWSPAREDLALELAGEIGPEASTMAERAQAKAARLDAIAENRARQANAFSNAADELSRAFTDGQPILVGHHSERKARKTQERMHSNMSKAVKAQKAIGYWQWRAEGVERHANYKNAPRVRANRIKTLLKELRDYQRTLHNMEKRRDYWGRVDNQKTAIALANHPDFSSYGTWGELDRGEKDWETAKTENIAIAERYLRPDSNCRRCIEHTLNRLAYESAMLGPVARYDGELTPAILQVFARTHGAHKPKAAKSDYGFTLESSVTLPLHLANAHAVDKSADEWRDLMQSCGYEVPAAKPKAPPILNFKADEIAARKRWDNDRETIRQVEMTKAQYSAIHSEQRHTRLSSCGQFRFKVCPDPFHKGPRYQAGWVAVFLTDSKVHPKPEPASEAA